MNDNKKKPGCGTAIIVLILSWFLAGALGQYLGNWFMGVCIIGGIIAALVIVVRMDDTSSGRNKDDYKPAPVPPDFSWAKADQKFREIHDVYRHISGFYIESKGDIAKCELIQTTDFNISITGYWTVKLQYYVENSDLFVAVHGSKVSPIKSERTSGDYISICTDKRKNGQYVIDHLYYGLDVSVELNNRNVGYLVVYTDIPGKMPIQTVKNRFESMKY